MTASRTYILWGSPHSYYTGKIRSYLIKKGVPYRELMPSHPDFDARVTPVIRNIVVPVIQAPDGRLIQDTTDMIEHLERAFPQPIMIPETPVQKAVAWLLGAFGSEALLPPGMHYRWSYRAEQEMFLRAEFGRLRYSGPDRAVRDEAGRQLMDYFNGFLPPLGVTATTIPTIETAYCELLDTLDQHFQQWPYLLGGRPSIADFGFMAPLFAHLGRDPVPATLMKNRAQNVFNWTERMNLPAIVDREFPDTPESFPADDAIPESLEPVLRLVFQDWGRNCWPTPRAITSGSRPIRRCPPVAWSRRPASARFIHRSGRSSTGGAASRSIGPVHRTACGTSTRRQPWRARSRARHARASTRWSGVPEASMSWTSSSHAR
jgi:glutathione S-transferase